MATLSATRGRRLRTVDYDQKVEQRAATHECLRNRNNLTTCRSPGRQDEVERKRGELQRKRQVEFLKRRNVGDTETLRSLVMAKDLGITWPNVHSAEQAPWATPLSSRWTENGIGRQRVTSPAPLIYPLLETMGKTDRGVQTTSSRHTQDTSAQTVSGLVTVKESDIYQLADYLKEALWREECLKQKLSLLQCQTSSLLQTSDKLWTAAVQWARCEEGLMRSKIGTLESQLQLCSQKFSRDGVKKLVLHMEEQRLAYEEKALAALHRALTEKAEAAEKVETLQGALQAAGAESAQWQGLYEELKETCSQMRSNQEQGTDLLQQLQNRLETAGGQEAHLRDQLGALERDGAESRHRIAFLEEDNRAKSVQLQELRERLWSFEDPSLTGNFFQSPSREMQDSIAQLCVSDGRLTTAPLSRQASELHDALQELCRKDKECVELRAELEAMEHECHACQSRLTQCREELRQLSARRTKGRCSLWLVLALLLVLVLAAVVLACVYHPPFSHTLQELYTDLQQHVEQYLQERASPRHAGCYRPI
ncbi:hypothetical protein AAFF_G00276650 [Aldrovandia affinis]|uniref:TRAF3 interacting protein 3 n=1 Tax=Aldrovandia affinis TaxID=143900 RepID=A0AAD7RB17_9TELE|nr:hypothetical protein AAFF_G00276650 [Aldrovandia affinis]